MNVLKAEIHCHNQYSNSHLGDLEPYHDCNVTIPQQIEQCYKLGLDVLFVTNHNTLDGYSESIEYRENHEHLKNLKIYPAEEVTADTGAHILVYGISETIKSGLTVNEILDEVKSQGAVSSAAHPFEIFNGIRNNAILCDMIEVFTVARSRRPARSGSSAIAIRTITRGTSLRSSCSRACGLSASRSGSRYAPSSSAARFHIPRVSGSPSALCCAGDRR